MSQIENIVNAEWENLLEESRRIENMKEKTTSEKYGSTDSTEISANIIHSLTQRFEQRDEKFRKQLENLLSNKQRIIEENKRMSEERKFLEKEKHRLETVRNELKRYKEELEVRAQIQEENMEIINEERKELAEQREELELTQRDLSNVIPSLKRILRKVHPNNSNAVHPNPNPNANNKQNISPRYNIYPRMDGEAQIYTCSNRRGDIYMSSGINTINNTMNNPQGTPLLQILKDQLESKQRNKINLEGGGSCAEKNNYLHIGHPRVKGFRNISGMQTQIKAHSLDNNSGISCGHSSDIQDVDITVNTHFIKALTDRRDKQQVKIQTQTQTQKPNKNYGSRRNT